MNNKKKSFKDMTLKERFDARGFSIQKYATAYGVSRQTIYDVFSGKATGKKDSSKKTGDVRRIIAQLKNDNIWIGPLPWEN